MDRCHREEVRLLALTKERILAADDMKRESVDIPEWGGIVYVRTMTGTERDTWERMMIAAKDKTSYPLRASLCALCICDDVGNRIFAVDEIDSLGEKSSAALDRIFEIATRLNKIGGNDVKELEGN